MGHTGVVHPSAEGPSGAPVCSARGCRSAAAWELRWNNPRLHDPARRKTWMACLQHRESLSEFLGARGFLRESVALAAPSKDAQAVEGTATGQRG